MATLTGLLTNTGGTTPAGSVVAFASNTAPSGYIKANGAQIGRVAYADLFAVCGTTFGSGNGSTTFTIPDLRGEFLRGWDDARTIDNGRAFGSYQAGNVGSHTHNVTVFRYSYSGGHFSPDRNYHSEFTQAQTTDNGTQQGETRPRNVAMLYCIKY
jgi:microcystin-dependent protein